MDEEQFILRLPPVLANRMRLELLEKSKLYEAGKEKTSSAFSYRFTEDGRNAFFTFDGVEYPAKLMDFPALIETHKATGRRTFYKSCDVHQALVVRMPREPAPNGTMLADGIMPPAKKAANRLAPQEKLFPREFVRSVEVDVKTTMDPKLELLHKKKHPSKKVKNKSMQSSPSPALTSKIFRREDVTGDREESGKRDDLEQMEEPFNRDEQQKIVQIRKQRTEAVFNSTNEKEGLSQKLSKALSSAIQNIKLPPYQDSEEDYDGDDNFNIEACDVVMKEIGSDEKGKSARWPMEPASQEMQSTTQLRNENSTDRKDYDEDITAEMMDGMDSEDGFAEDIATQMMDGMGSDERAGEEEGDEEDSDDALAAELVDALVQGESSEDNLVADSENDAEQQDENMRQIQNRIDRARIDQNIAEENRKLMDLEERAAKAPNRVLRSRILNKRGPIRKNIQELEKSRAELDHDPSKHHIPRV